MWCHVLFAIDQTRLDIWLLLRPRRPVGERSVSVCVSIVAAEFLLRSHKPLGEGGRTKSMCSCPAACLPAYPGWQDISELSQIVAHLRSGHGEFASMCEDLRKEQAGRRRARRCHLGHRSDRCCDVCCMYLAPSLPFVAMLGQAKHVLPAGICGRTASAQRREPSSAWPESPCIRKFRPAADGWLEWHLRTWRGARDHLIAAWGCRPAVRARCPRSAVRRTGPPGRWWEDFGSGARRTAGLPADTLMGATAQVAVLVSGLRPHV